MTSTRTLVSMLALASAVARAVAGDVAPSPIVNGPAVASAIHFEFAIYYPERPAVEPLVALRARLGAGANLPRLVARLSKDPAGFELSVSSTSHALEDYAPTDASMTSSEDGITRVRHDARLLAARDAARARLPELRDTFNRGLAPGDYIDVKAPFATDSGGREWMWVEVRTWNGDRIEGTLQNQPDDVKRLRSGQDVVVSQAELFDYLFHRADGRVEGNTTGAIIAEQERAGQ